MEFKSFDKIQPIGRLFMTITQKLHGTNAQIMFDENGNYKAGSRTRWLELNDDNYGFCNWVEANKMELFGILGVGRHYGEWVGKGINNGEGLENKKLVLFNHRRWVGKTLPAGVTTVPELYYGKFCLDTIEQVMEQLKTQGSRLVPGFMHPEGIVVEIDGQRYKKVFNPEETQWVAKKQPRAKSDVERPDVSHLIQPLRLEKLLIRDERYRREYPQSLRDIASSYIDDLWDENQLTEGEKDNDSYCKELNRQVFLFIKQVMA